MTINCFIEKVMKKAQREYTDFYITVHDGSLKLEDLESVADSLCKLERSANRFNKIDLVIPYFQQMFNTYKMNQKLIDQRFKQFKTYFKLKNIAEIAKIVLEIITDYEKLEGDYEVLKDIVSSYDLDSCKTKTLQDFNEKMLDIFDQLEEISNENFIVCLKKYTDNYSFIEWIRKNAPSTLFFQLIF